jgi:UDP-N-acetylmuramate--alanine ligase
VGIGGAGMSGIAEILHQQGYRSRAPTRPPAPPRARLAGLGVRVHIGHDAAQVAGAEAVVTSTAVQARQPRGVAARAAACRWWRARVLLAELMR